MKKKSDLKKKVLCSLLAASTLGIFYSGNALAAQVNGVEVPENGVITNEWLNTPVNQGGPGSQKFIIAQGDKVVIATHSDVKNLITGIQNALKDTSIVGTMDKVNAIRQVLAENNIVIGVVGGEGQLDSGLTGTLTNKDLNGFVNLKDLVDNKLGAGTSDKILNIDTTKEEKDVVIANNGDTYLKVGDDEKSPVVIGLIGGDLSVNSGIGIDVKLNPDSDSYQQIINNEQTSINRSGNVNNDLVNGNVLGGVGASAAISVGNIEANALGILNITLDGYTNVTLDGNVTTNVYDKANLGAFANGGGAIAVGGTANSTVTGDTTLNIIGGENVMKEGIDGINVGVAGGGVALTTIGGEATSTVEGSTNINVQDGFALGVIGGGVAGSGDATGAVELIKGGNTDIGNNDGHSGTSLAGLVNINVTDAIQGGTAQANVKGDTNINLTGNTTAIGVIGGGVAAASHTYQEKDGNNNSTDKQLGSSTAKATTDGRVTIDVDLVSPNKDAAADNIGTALGNVISSVGSLIKDDGEEGDVDISGIISGTDISSAVGQGAAVGVFGGGVAFGHGDLRGSVNGENGAFATATTNGADINLNSGYAAGVFNGGAAITLNNANAEAIVNNDVNTTVYSDMKAVGMFGGGFALSMEGTTGGTKVQSTDVLANSSVTTSNINVKGGVVDGIYGGGMAIGNSVLNSNGNDAVTTVTNSNITVDSGTINNLELISIMDASKNDNNTENGYPQWNSLGLNASMAMADLKGITDETSIAAGGMGMGMTGYSEVENANITINGGTVKKDILGGGIAVDNIAGDNKDTKDVREGAGAHVVTSTITLNGGTVEGSVYAGGAVNGTTPSAVKDAYKGHENDKGNSLGFDSLNNTSSTVGTAKVVLNGTKVNGEISGQGYRLTTVYSDKDDYNPYNGNQYEATYTKDAYNDSVGKSTLEITGNNTLKPLETSPDDNYISTGSKIHSFNIINVKDGSVTKVEGLNNTTALIDAAGTQVDVDGSAKLDISALEMGTGDGNTYKVISNTGKGDKAWTDSNLVYDRTEGYATGTEATSGRYDITYKDLASLSETEKTEAVNDFVGSLGEGGENFEGAVNGIIRNGENTFAGAKEFFKDASSTGDNSGLAAMAMIGEAAGVTSNTIDVAGDMADNSVLRLSFTQDDITGEPKVNEDGAIWAKYIHNKHDLDGMASSFGSIDSSSDFDGATVGVDFAKKGKVQSGIAFSYGDGDSHGMGINNDFDMWGLTLYGNVKNDDTNVIADIGFSESDNELTGKAMGKDIKADRDVSVFTVGVRAEKLYTNGSTQIVPYTGLRYYNVDPDSYTAYYDGQKFGEYDADRQNIWTLPVGVSLRNETVTESGWRLTPKVDVAYIWAFGDTDNSFDLNTGSGVDTLDYTVMDSGSWLGSVGFEAGKDDWAFGVGYSYQKGSHEEANKWFVNVEYSF